MEEHVKDWMLYVALGVEIAAAILIAAAAVQAFGPALRALFARPPIQGAVRRIWLNFARWLVLALEFELAADIVRTAVSPSWTDIGELGAIALIRTFLNFFLERDLERVAEVDRAGRAEAASER